MLLSVVAVLPAAVAVGAVMPPGRVRFIWSEDVGWAARIVVSHRAALELGAVGVGFLAERAHGVLQPRSGSRVHRLGWHDDGAPAVPIDHIGRPGLRLAAREATIGDPLA